MGPENTIDESPADASALVTPAKPELDAELVEARTLVARLERRVARERTAREQAEAIADRRMRELWLANQELDARVAERTEELAEALERISTTTRAVDGFVANMSHEMLTPLNGIVGMLELLGDHSHSDTMKSHVATALSSSDRLGRLIKRLLDLVSLRAGLVRASVEPTTGAALVDRVTDRWRIQALSLQKLLTVSHDLGDDEFHVDPARVEQIAGELIDNSIKYAAPGPVSVWFSKSDPGDGGEPMLEVKVSDHGAGFEVPPDQDLFEALDLLGTDGLNGAGIGLILVRKLAAQLGGSVMITSCDGNGSEATLRLPITDRDKSSVT